MRYVVWFIGLLAIVIFSIFGVILIRNTLRGFRAASPVNVEVVRINDYDLATAKVVYVIDGPVVADENYRSIRFEISAGQRTATVFQGFQGAVLRQQQLGNNIVSFTDFTAALDNAGFGREQEQRTRLTRAEASAGRCATGRFYTMQILTNSEIASDLWSSGCGTLRSSSFGGNRSAVERLFQLQFPDYNQLVNNIGGRF